MNRPMVLSILCKILLCLAALLLVPMGVALYFGESPMPFLLTSLIVLPLGAAGFLLRFNKQRFYARDGFATVALAWLLLCLFGALPFVFSGAIPGYIDAFFETVSGFTTTGATILTEIESLPRGILFWRSFTHWLGGMGVLVLALAILPSMGARTIQLLRAESTGPTPSRLVPRIADTAKILYTIYAALTVLNVACLLLCGVGAYDAWITALGTAGTGGFSNLNSSVAGLNNLPAEIVTTVFMLLFGVNFSMHFLLLRREWKAVFRNEELRLYALLIAGSMLCITIDITPFYGAVSTALRHASFQVASIITTTGYATTNFDVWPGFSKAILMLLMITGACAGSTGGGLKILRVLVLFKAIRQEVYRILHPRMIRPLHMDGKLMDMNVSNGILLYTGLYLVLWVAAILIVSLQGLSFEATVSATISAISNIGPGFAEAYANFDVFSPVNKVVLSLCMLIGRLEIFPFLLALSPSMWKRSK